MNTSSPFDASPDPVVILGNGLFPTHPVPLALLKKAPVVVCCDGAVEKLLAFEREPDIIVGDMDSISSELRARFADRVFPSDDQETNDQTKAFQFCVERGWLNVRILGATGLREDHNLGNISLLGDYLDLSNGVSMVTDYGIFVPVNRSTSFAASVGQQISLFSLSPHAPLTTLGLKYPLHNYRLNSWWQGSLNEAVEEEFSLSFSDGKFLVFLKYAE